MALTSRDFDITEAAACKAIAQTLADPGAPDTPVVIPRHELEAFLAWVVEEFAKNMREYVNGGEVPF